MPSSEEFSFEALEPVELAPYPAVALASDPVAVAHAEAERIRAEARQAGWAEGHAQGVAAAREELRSAAAALAEAVTQIRALAGEAADAVERDAVELALALADKLVGSALDADPDLIVDAVRGALRRLVERERVTILVNPDDLPHVREAIGDLIRELGGIDQCEVQAERRVGRGGAIVRTDAGEIDARVETMLARAAELLRDAGEA